MRRTGRFSSAVLALGLLVVGVSAAAPPAGPVEAASTYRAGLRQAINQLPVRGETPAGYARSKFPHWVDANHDGQNTRAEVLINESRVQVTFTNATRSTVRTGRWYSYYDGRTWRRASDVDIDHLVPLKEAWDSGAKRWNLDTRRRFANDLRDGRTLVAVTDNVNQAKGQRDPAQWLPAKAKCKYIKQWVAVKHRWKLSIDVAEKQALHRVRRNTSCTGTIKVTKARVVLRSSGGSTPTCDPSYPTVCIPPPPPDLNCADISYRNFKVLPPDPHGFDGNNDGVGCQT